MTFRDRLLGTLQLLRPVLDEPGVLVVGSEVPNLLQPNAASTLVVSQDVDLAVPVERVNRIKESLRELDDRLVQSTEEPSVYTSTTSDLIEVNFLGLDATIRDVSQTYVLDDPQLPLMVFGPIGLLRPGPIVQVGTLRVPLPRPGDLIVEKLLTDRSGEKGARDLLVVAGMLSVATDVDLDEMIAVAGTLSAEARHSVRSNLTVLSLMDGSPGMPDPTPFRATVARLVARIEAALHD